MKKVYISFLLHGNMCYDRYTKQEIRDKFPKIYAAGIKALYKFPEITAHIDFPGLTTLSLKHHAKWLIDEMKPLIERRQLVMVGCQYAASHSMCSDEESDLVAARAGMEIMRDELQPDVSTFFPQEIAFHPQLPYIMNRIGAKRLIVMPYGQQYPDTKNGWKRPRRVKGIDGSEVIVYPVDFHSFELENLEEFYDNHEDGDFVMTGGDFEMLINVEEFAGKIRELAGKGKIIEWMTVDRYEEEIGVRDRCSAPNPFGHGPEDRESSPSFSRWVSHPEDMIWHGYAVKAMDAIRSAGFAVVAARIHDLGEIDAPIENTWTTEPDNAWDNRFEEVLEYPETEEKYLTFNGKPSLLSRAWHQLLIGLNSDASGWFPWEPRTRHRNISLQASRSLSNEILIRFAKLIAEKIKMPDSEVIASVIALNPAPARTVEVEMETESPMIFTEFGGRQIKTAISLQDGKWVAGARIELPAYGYKALGLAAGSDIETYRWACGSEVMFAGKTVVLSNGILRISEGEKSVEVTVSPFKLSDPSRAAEDEDIVPNWKDAETRIRQTALGEDMEVFVELAWTVWMRLVISLHVDWIEINVEVHVDMPRRIGNLKYDPEGFLLEFKGKSGSVFYDVPYATIRHKNDNPSFIAVQRFVAMESGTSSFGLIALEGNQSFKVKGKEGVIAVGLGASIQGRPDTRPECNILPDGTCEHKITSGGDPFMGSYYHRFALIFGDRTETAAAARRLRTAVPLIRVETGDGKWPAEQSLFKVEPDTAHITAFRETKDGCEITVNDFSGEECKVSCAGKLAELNRYGVATIRI